MLSHFSLVKYKTKEPRLFLEDLPAFCCGKQVLHGVKALFKAGTIGDKHSARGDTQFSPSGSTCVYQSIYQIIWSSNTLSGISEFGYGLNYAFAKNVFSPLSKILKWTFIIVTKLYESALPSSHKGHRWNVAGLK